MRGYARDLGEADKKASESAGSCGCWVPRQGSLDGVAVSHWAQGSVGTVSARHCMIG